MKNLSPDTRMLGDRSNHSTNLPLRIKLCSLLYLNSCLLIAVRSTKQVGVFLGKCVRAAAITMIVDRKNQKALALLYLGSGPLPNTANSSLVPTEFEAEPTTNNFSNLNFLPSPRKTTEYSFELFLSICRYLTFSQVLNFTSVELNRIAKQK